MGDERNKLDEVTGRIIGDQHLRHEDNWEYEFLDDPEAKKRRARKARIASLIGTSGLFIVAIVPPLRNAVIELFYWCWIIVIAYIIVPWVGFILLALAIAAVSGVWYFLKTGKMPGLDDPHPK